MGKEIISKLDLKVQIEFQRTEMRNEAFQGGPEKGRRVPDMQEASGWAGLVGAPQGPTFGLLPYGCHFEIHNKF